jgi:hypothetical protein
MEGSLEFIETFGIKTKNGKSQFYPTIYIWSWLYQTFLNRHVLLIYN